MDTGGFIHLHVHSHYSVGEGASSVERLARAAAALGLKTLALTDTHSLAGMVRFVRACRAHGIRPIVGCELNVVADANAAAPPSDVSPATTSASPATSAAASASPAPSTRSIAPTRPPSRAGSSEGGKLVFLVQGELGFRQIVRLTSLAHANIAAPAPAASPAPAPLALQPFVTLEQVADNARDLVVLTGGLEGELWRLAQRGNIGGAEAWLRRLADAVGMNNLVVELAHDGRPRDDRACRILVDLARATGVPFVAANDVRFASPGEDLLLHFLQGRPVDGRRSVGDYAGEERDSLRYLAPPDEMARRFADFPEALENTFAVAERCEFELPSSRRRFPMHNFVRGLDADSFLWDSVFRRATQRFGDLSTTLKDRLNREFDDLRRADLCNAIVFLCRLNEELERRGVLRGPGSGPLSTSLIAAVLGLTRFDPLRHGLDYISPRNENAPFPVFRVEVAEDQVGAVLNSLRSIYENAVVCRVGRWERWEQGSLLDALANWTGLPAQRVPRIVESEEWREALAREEGRPESQRPDPALRLRSPEVFAYIARRLEGAPRELNAVPGQFLLTVENLTNVVSRERPEAGMGVSQLEAEDLESLHLARLDVVSHPLLDIIERATAWIRLQENPNFHADGVAAEDVKTAQLLAEGMTTGITPLESPIAKSLLRARRPGHVDELAAIIAELAVQRRHTARSAPAIDPGQVLATAILCHICAWLKAHHPAAFYAATLSQFFPQRRRFRSIWREARRRGLALLPPDINVSAWEFSHEGRNAVRCGLMIVGGLGRRAFEELDHARRSMAFFELADVARRTDPRRLRASQLENLVRVGACDAFGPSRAHMLHQLPMLLEVARPRETRLASRQPLIFFDRPTHEWISEMAGDGPADPTRPDPIAQRLALEQHAAGFPVSADPLDLFADLLSTMNAILPWQLTPRMEGKPVRLAGHIEGIERSGPLIRGDVVAVADLSGCMALVPSALKTALGATSLIPGAVILSGVIERQDFEWRLKTESIQSLQAIWDQAMSTERLVLDLKNADRRVLKAVIKALKRFPGHVAVEATGGGAEPKRLMAQVGKLSVLPCPPLEEELAMVLGRERLGARRREDSPGIFAGAATGCAAKRAAAVSSVAAAGDSARSVAGAVTGAATTA